MALRTTPPPARQLAELLTVAKRDGQDFDTAWPAAFHSVRWPKGHHPARRERDVILSTKGEWRAAYLDLPTPVARALPTLLDAVELDAVERSEVDRRDELDRALLSGWAAGTDTHELAGAYGVSEDRVHAAMRRVRGTPVAERITRQRRIARKTSIRPWLDPSPRDQAARAA